MSFLGALGRIGGGLLSRGVGFLQRAASPITSRLGSLFTSAFAGAKNLLGNTAMENLYNKGVNAAMGGVHKFA